MTDSRTVGARAIKWLTLIAILPVSGTSSLLAQQPTSPTPIRITWLGHAAVEIVSSTGTRLLIDPWIGDNPATPAAFKDSTRDSTLVTRPDAILVKHAHGDHDADVARLARVSNDSYTGTRTRLRPAAQGWTNALRHWRHLDLR